MHFLKLPKRNILHCVQNPFSAINDCSLTQKAPPEELLVGICTNIYVDSESAIKTLFFFENLHATLDSQVTYGFAGYVLSRPLAYVNRMCDIRLPYI